MTTVGRLFLDYRLQVLAGQAAGEATGKSLAHLLEPMGQMHIEAVSQEDIVHGLERIAAHAPVHADRIQSHARAFFSWAIGREIIHDNPARGLPPVKVSTVRGRQLSLDEMILIWHAAGVLNPRLTHAVRLLILTAAQRDQVGGIRLGELKRHSDTGAFVWGPSGKSVDDGEPLQVVLPPLAGAIVETAILQRCQGGDFILSRGGNSPIDGWSKAKRTLDDELRRISPEAFEPWWINDLRLSFPLLASQYAGVDPQVAEGRLGRISRFGNPRTREWSRSAAMAEEASEALADWDKLLASRLGESGA
jgi:hypothetical protein